MSDSVKTHTRILLQQVTKNDSDPTVLFMGRGSTQMELSRDEWDEMGCPQTIIVTVDRPRQ